MPVKISFSKPQCQLSDARMTVALVELVVVVLAVSLSDNDMDLVEMLEDEVVVALVGFCGRVVMGGRRQR